MMPSCIYDWRRGGGGRGEEKEYGALMTGGGEEALIRLVIYISCISEASSLPHVPANMSQSLLHASISVIILNILYYVIVSEAYKLCRGKSLYAL